MRLGVSFDNPRVSSGFDFQRQRKEIAKPYELQAELGIVQMARSCCVAGYSTSFLQTANSLNRPKI